MLKAKLMQINSSISTVNLFSQRVNTASSSEVLSSASHVDNTNDTSQVLPSSHQNIAKSIDLTNASFREVESMLLSMKDEGLLSSDDVYDIQTHLFLHAQNLDGSLNEKFNNLEYLDERIEYEKSVNGYENLVTLERFKNLFEGLNSLKSANINIKA